MALHFLSCHLFMTSPQLMVGTGVRGGRGLCEHSPHIFFFRIKRENSTNKHIFARSKWLSSLTPHHQAARTGLYKYFCFNLFLHKISCKQKQINFANCLFQLPVSAFFKQATFHSGKGVQAIIIKSVLLYYTAISIVLKKDIVYSYKLAGE